MNLRLPAAVIALCLFATLGAAAGGLRGERAEFFKTEPGLEPYRLRMLATAHFLRMDDGDDAGDFTLFDRDRQVIFNVVHARRNVLVLPRRDVVMPGSDGLVVTERYRTLRDAPPVNGKQPRHYVLAVNGERCRDVVALEGLLPQLLSALREFRALLATEHARVLPAIPADMREDCDLALTTVFPEKQLSFGMPIREWDGQGNIRELIDFDSRAEFSTDLFELPAQYQRFTPGAR